MQQAPGLLHLRRLRLYEDESEYPHPDYVMWQGGLNWDEDSEFYFDEENGVWLASEPGENNWRLVWQYYNSDEGGVGDVTASDEFRVVLDATWYRKTFAPSRDPDAWIRAMGAAATRIHNEYRDPQFLQEVHFYVMNEDGDPEYYSTMRGAVQAQYHVEDILQSRSYVRHQAQRLKDPKNIVWAA